jgi:5-methylcytosine-specific restriction endonuclease McrA
MSERSRSLRYLKPLPGIALESTLGKPYQDGDYWVVRMQCSDGRVRTFRTGPKTVRGRNPLSMSQRFRILARDGFRCFYCGRTPDKAVELRVDHIMPVNAGGSNDDDNLVTSCHDCNAGKSDSTLEAVGIVDPIVASRLFPTHD